MSTYRSTPGLLDDNVDQQLLDLISNLPVLAVECFNDLFVIIFENQKLIINVENDIGEIGGVGEDEGWLEYPLLNSEIIGKTVIDIEIKSNKEFDPPLLLRNIVFNDEHEITIKFSDQEIFKIHHRHYSKSNNNGYVNIFVSY